MWQWLVSGFTLVMSFFITTLLKRRLVLLAAVIPSFYLNTAASDLHLLGVRGGGGQMETWEHAAFPEFKIHNFGDWQPYTLEMLLQALLWFSRCSRAWQLHKPIVQVKTWTSAKLHSSVQLLLSHLSDESELLRRRKSKVIVNPRWEQSVTSFKNQKSGARLQIYKFDSNVPGLSQTTRRCCDTDPSIWWKLSHWKCFLSVNQFWEEIQSDLWHSRTKNYFKGNLCQRRRNIQRANGFTVRFVVAEFTVWNTWHVRSCSSSSSWLCRRWTGGTHQPGDLGGDPPLLPCHLDGARRPRRQLSSHLRDRGWRTRPGGEMKLGTLRRSQHL